MVADALGLHFHLLAAHPHDRVLDRLHGRAARATGTGWSRPRHRPPGSRSSCRRCRRTSSGLVAFLRRAPPLPFRFVSVHGPSKDRRMSDDELVSLLGAAARARVGDRHAPRRDGRPRALPAPRPPAVHREHGRAQAPGQYGRRAAALLRRAARRAGFCFDVAHARAVDPSLEVARELLSRFSLRLSHVHLSSLDAEQHHVPLTDADQEAFAAGAQALQRRAVDPGSAARSRATRPAGSSGSPRRAASPSITCARRAS